MNVAGKTRKFVKSLTKEERNILYDLITAMRGPDLRALWGAKWEISARIRALLGFENAPGEVNRNAFPVHSELQDTLNSIYLEHEVKVNHLLKKDLVSIIVSAKYHYESHGRHAIKSLVELGIVPRTQSGGR